MKKILAFGLIVSVVSFQGSLVLAQLDAPVMEEPAMEEPSTKEPEAEPVMETVAPSDTTPPVISDVMQASVEPTMATFVWTTDELASSTLKYGTTKSYGNTAALDASQTTMHTVMLTELTPDTLYYYCITATDSSGNTADYCGHSFTTEAEETPADSNPPTIESVSVSNITEDGAEISWTTDEVSDGYVEYGPTPDYGSQTPLVTDYTTDHTATLSGLDPDTVYFYRVVSSDGVGNTAKSSENNFSTETLSGEPATEENQETEPEPEPTPPANPTPEESPEPKQVVISGVEVVNVTKDSATIVWTTDAPADSELNYGDSTALGTLTPKDSTLKTSHSVTLNGLTENTAYYFKARSASSGANVATKSDLHDFATLEVPKETVAPAEILKITEGTLTSSTFAISAETDKKARSYIEYGLKTDYGEITAENALRTSHTFNLSGLVENTKYHYRLVMTDEAGNITYSLDSSFTTLKEPVSEQISGTAASSGPITSGPEETEPTDIPEVKSKTLSPPTLIEAKGLENQNFFIWENPGDDSFAGVKIVRKSGAYPASISDGFLIYKGDKETFTDTQVQNDTPYYYAIYSYDKIGEYSKPIHVKLVPKASMSETSSSSGSGIAGGPIISSGKAVSLPSISIIKAPVIVEESPREHFVAELEKGDRGLEVRHLQRLLEAEGHFARENQIDGIFGQRTERALLRFQEVHNLPETKKTTPFTREKLNLISQNEVVLSLPDDITLFETSLKSGSSGEEVEALQKFLLHEGSLENGVVDGKYGSRTRAGVRNFQIKHKITPVDGHFGPITRHRAEVISGI